jgi:GH25 family lysozyme M1 (1,4-beta-N-acetylmuramidase)
MQATKTQYLRGIDLSHWNGSIDFHKVKESGVQIVMLKATEGINHVDRKLEANYQSAKAVGLNVGFYHFFLPEDREHACKQAGHFARTLSAMPADCRYALDVESNKKQLSYELLSKLVLAFLEAFEDQTKQSMMIYASHQWLEALSEAEQLLCRYPVWLAQWSQKDQPSPLTAWQEWLGWQHSSQGQVPGIWGAVDLNWFDQKVLD